MTRTKALVNNLLMNNLQWKSNLDNKSRTIEIVILKTKWKDCRPRKKLCTKNFTYTKKFYVHEIAAVNLLKFYSWKTQRKHVNQTTAIEITIELENWDKRLSKIVFHFQNHGTFKFKPEVRFLFFKWSVI